MGTDQTIADYLDQLEAALVRSGCSPSRRAEFVGEISEHIEQARAQLPVETEVSVKRMLDRIGRPDELAAEAAQDEATNQQASPRLRQMFLLGSVAAVVLVGVVLGLVLTLPASSGLPIRLPNLLNEQVTTALAKLHRLGVAQSRVMIEEVPQPVPWLPSRLVLAQSPAVGSSLSPGARVVLRVSRGRPMCRPDRTVPPSTLSITMEHATSNFERACYYARAERPLSIRLTNDVVALGSGVPTSLQLIISPSQHPAMTPVPGRPGLFTGSAATTVVVGPNVLAPNSAVFSVPPLNQGTYIIEVLQLGPDKSATLVVS